MAMKTCFTKNLSLRKLYLFGASVFFTLSVFSLTHASFSGDFSQSGGATYKEGFARGFGIAVYTISIGAPYIYVTGMSDNKYVTIKYDSSGVLISSAVLSPPSPWNAAYIAVSSIGDVFVAGGIHEGGDRGAGIFIAKYNSDLVLLSSAIFNSVVSFDAAHSIAINQDNDIYIAGVSIPYCITLKYDSDLVFKSSAVFNAVVDENFVGYNPGRDIAIDKYGNIYVTGYQEYIDVAAFIVKYDADLVFLSSAVYNAEGRSVIAYDGGIYAQGNVVNGENVDTVILKYDTSLNLLKKTVYNFNGCDYGQDMVLDKDDNLYVIGYGSVGTVVKYNSDLIFQSSASLGGWFPQGVSTDGSGEAYIHGYIGYGDGYRTVKRRLPDAPIVENNTEYVFRIKVPQNGKKVSGNRVTVMAEVEKGDIAEVREILFQYRTSEMSYWMAIPAADTMHPNPDISYPYFTHWDVTSLTDGGYNIRAVLKDKTGNLSISDEISVFVDRNNYDIKENIIGGIVEKKQKISPSQESVVAISGVQNNAYVEVKIPPGAVADYSVLKVKSDSSMPLSANRAEKIQLCEIVFESGQTEILGDLPAEITFSYSDADSDGIVDGTNVRENELAIFSYNQNYASWEKSRATKTDKEKKTCTASVKHFSVYGLFGSVASELSDILVYPNPYVPNDGKADTGRPYSISDSETGIIFENLTSDVRISIYTVSGECVFDRYIDDTGGSYRWNAANSAGQDVASGIYFAVIKTPSNGRKITRKIAVVR